jgi:hypothetical protein
MFCDRNDQIYRQLRVRIFSIPIIMIDHIVAINLPHGNSITKTYDLAQPPKIETYSCTVIPRIFYLEWFGRSQLPWIYQIMFELVHHDGVLSDIVRNW